jgi:hypothetical protein
MAHKTHFLFEEARIANNFILAKKIVLFYLIKDFWQCDAIKNYNMRNGCITGCVHQ